MYFACSPLFKVPNWRLKALTECNQDNCELVVFLDSYRWKCELNNEEWRRRGPLISGARASAHKKSEVSPMVSCARPTRHRVGMVAVRLPCSPNAHTRPIAFLGWRSSSKRARLKPIGPPSGGRVQASLEGLANARNRRSTRPPVEELL